MLLDLPSCAQEIAELYQVPIELIAAVRVQEGGCVGERTTLPGKGKFDIGPMQINSWWFEEHSRSLGQFGITVESVENDFCQNIAVAAYILKKNYVSYGNDWWNAISAYNLGRPDKGTKYLKSVLKNLQGVNHLIEPKCEK